MQTLAHPEGMGPSPPDECAQGPAKNAIFLLRGLRTGPPKFWTGGQGGEPSPENTKYKILSLRLYAWGGGREECQPSVLIFIPLSLRRDINKDKKGSWGRTGSERFCLLFLWAP